MKRDMDLIRKILLEVEEQEGSSKWPTPHTIPGYTPEQICYHVVQLREGGLIRAREYLSRGVTLESDGSTTPFKPGEWRIYKLTWEGHNFLDAIRADTIWEKTKDKMSEKGYGLQFEIIKDIALELIKAALNQ